MPCKEEDLRKTTGGGVSDALRGIGGVNGQVLSISQIGGYPVEVLEAPGVGDIIYQAIK